MEDLVQALYDETGIALKAEHLALDHVDGRWTLYLRGHRVGRLPGDPDDPPDAWTVVESLGGARRALSRAMVEGLSEAIPSARRAIAAEHPDYIVEDLLAEVVDAGDLGRARHYTVDADLEQGWPHFVLVLTRGELDVEIDADPYSPEAPFDLDEVRRQAAVLIRATRSGS